MKMSKNVNVANLKIGEAIICNATDDLHPNDNPIKIVVCIRQNNNARLLNNQGLSRTPIYNYYRKSIQDAKDWIKQNGWNLTRI